MAASGIPNCKARVRHGDAGASPPAEEVVEVLEARDRRGPGHGIM